MASATSDATGDITGDHKPQLARLSWLTAFFFVLFSLLSMIVVTIALIYTINDKQAAQDEVQTLQRQNECRSGFAQASDLAILTAFEALLEPDQNVRTEKIAEAKRIVEGAADLRSRSQEVCAAGNQAIDIAPKTTGTTLD